jgi:tetratricopeptide (TPR) repeat protein
MTIQAIPRPPRPRAAALLLASAALATATWAAGVLTAAPSGPLAAEAGLGSVIAPSGPTAPFAELEALDRSVAVWTANLAAESEDFLSGTNLALLLEARGRLSGDVSDHIRAKAVAAQALSAEPAYLPARLLHARLQLALHDFRAALAEAESIDRTAPDQPAVLAVIGDALLELGDVDAAAEAFQRLDTMAPGPAVAARLARLDFLRGEPKRATERAETGFGAAELEGESGPELSWYASLVGTLSLAAGEPETAGRWFARGLEAWPRSHAALAGLARVDAATGRIDAAIERYEQAVAIAPQPETLAALSDLYALRGDEVRAAAYRNTVLAIAMIESGAGGPAVDRPPIQDRQLIRFLVDHDLDPPRALDLATADLAARRDVYAHDAYAWALLANDRAIEADRAMADALALGTRDAVLLYHAGVVAAAVGDGERAEELLRHALSIRGALDPLAADRASKTLAGLRASR